MKIVYANPQIDEIYIYLAVIYYYYYTIVLEYYITDMCPVKLLFKKLNMPKNHVKTVEGLIMEITTSDEDWASYVRRKLNGWNKDTTSSFHGGRRTKVKRKNTKKKTSKKRRKYNL